MTNFIWLLIKIYVHYVCYNLYKIIIIIEHTLKFCFVWVGLNLHKTMAFRPTGYQKAFLEVSSALQQNQEAFKTLHTVYKLPNSYASLPASATVQAMEALGVFSENDPVGIIDLPLVVGMKSTHKKVKKQMRTKVKYQGFKGITYGKVKPQLEKIVATIHETFQLLISQIELLDMVVANQENGTSNQLDSVILAVKNSKDMMDKSVEVVHKRKLSSTYINVQ